MDRPDSYRDDFNSSSNDSIKVDTFGTNIPGQQPLNPAAALNLTPADLALMRECVVESFQYRSVPLFAANAAILYYINSVKPFSRGLKVPLVLSGIGSVLLGRYMYGNECAEKFINAKHQSAFVDNVRRVYGRKPSEFSEDKTGYGDDTYSFDQPQSHFNSRNNNSYFNEREERQSSMWQRDDSHLRNDDDDRYSNENDGDVKRSVTYDDLRNQNRAKWQAPAYPMPSARVRRPDNQVDSTQESRDYKSF